MSSAYATTIRKRSPDTEDYLPDDGFVVNDSGRQRKKAKRTAPAAPSTRTTRSTDPKPKAAPVTRKPKTDKKKNDSPTKQRRVAAGAGAGARDGRADGALVDANGDVYWAISPVRRVTLNKYQGRQMINVREYYEKDGEMLPGKRGIAMPMDQYATFVRLLPAIEKVLKDQGVQVPRPEYESLDGEEDTAGEDEDEEDDEVQHGGYPAGEDEGEGQHGEDRVGEDEGERQHVEDKAAEDEGDGQHGGDKAGEGEGAGQHVGDKIEEDEEAGQPVENEAEEDEGARHHGEEKTGEVEGVTQNGGGKAGQNGREGQNGIDKSEHKREGEGQKKRNFDATSDEDED